MEHNQVQNKGKVWYSYDVSIAAAVVGIKVHHRMKPHVMVYVSYSVSQKSFASMALSVEKLYF